VSVPDPLLRSLSEEASERVRLSPVAGGQRDSFGPNMSLVKDLFEAGERQAVLTFLDECQAFWKMDRGRLKQWADQVNSSRLVDFGADLATEQPRRSASDVHAVIASDFSSDERLIDSAAPRTQPLISRRKVGLRKLAWRFHGAGKSLLLRVRVMLF
jgi:hypothetical protein